jgi:hypothetical protein
MTVKQIWYTNCKNCNKQLINRGSGRPRGYCNQRCYLDLCKKNYVPKYGNRGRVAINLSVKEAHKLVNAAKLKFGKCALHPFYNNGDDYICTPDRLRAFCWDHIDRQTKVSTIARMIGGSTREELIAEINKCWLVCANCHQIKTYENMEYLKITKSLQIQMAEQFEQMSLFEN